MRCRLQLDWSVPERTEAACHGWIVARTATPRSKTVWFNRKVRYSDSTRTALYDLEACGSSRFMERWIMGCSWYLNGEQADLRRREEKCRITSYVTYINNKMFVTYLIKRLFKWYGSLTQWTRPDKSLREHNSLLYFCESNFICSHDFPIHFWLFSP